MKISGTLFGLQMGAKLKTPILAHGYLGAKGQYLFGQPVYDGYLQDRKTSVKGDSSDEVYTLTSFWGRTAQPLENLNTKLDFQIGVGYQYLNNDVQTPTGYQREQMYFYTPLTLSIRQPVDKSWSTFMSFEYDHFWSGRNTAHFGDADPTYPTMKMKQNTGHGYEATIGAEHNMPNFSFIAEIFYRSWAIGRSETSRAKKTDGSTITAYEPSNKTDMAGLGVGLRF